MKLLAAVLALLLPLSTCLRAADDPKDTRPVKVETAPGKTEIDTPPDAADSQAVPDAKLYGKMDFSAIELLAIQDGGRKKPLHTFMTEEIEQIVGRPLFSGTPYLKDKATNEKVIATDLFLSMWLGTRKWDQVPVLLLSYRPLAKELGLPETEKYVSVDQLKRSPNLEPILKSAHTKRREGKDAELTDVEKEAEILSQRVEKMVRIIQGDENLNIVPHPTDRRGSWMSLKGLADMFRGEEKPPYTREQVQKLYEGYKAMAESYRERDNAKFVAASQSFRTTLAELSPSVYPAYDALAREVSYNNTRPFGRAWLFYLSAVILGVLVFRTEAKWPFRIVMALFLAGLSFHVYGFVIRCIIAGRPPVSNMFESVVWVGFGAVFFGLIFELKYKVRYFLLSGAGAGFLCLVLMDIVPVVMGNPGMPGFEPSLRPLVPVLRDNFWLTVHVLTITLSYAAFMLAWVLGHVTLTAHLVRPDAKAQHHALHSFVYRAIQIGVLLLATGTILGGVWAYYSWGRFWGWDPKETWAFISLLCYLFVLHGRFAGWWSNFGMSVGSVLCFQAIVMAWYGVNFYLGSLGNGGLHSYGVGAGGEEWVIGAVVADLVFTITAVTRYAIHRSGGGGDRDDDPPATQLTSTDPVLEASKIGSAGE